MIFLGDNITFQCAVVMRINYLTRVTEARRVYGIMGGSETRTMKTAAQRYDELEGKCSGMQGKRKRKQKQKRRP